MSCTQKKNSDYKCNSYHRLGHLEPYCFSKMHDLRWSKVYISNDSRHLKSSNAK